MNQSILTLTLTLLALASYAHAEDWPQWMGPTRDGIWAESGIVEKLPAAGPPVKWRAEVHGGYSGPAVADGRVFIADYQTGGDTVGDPGKREVLEGTERVLCLSSKDGKQLWEHKYSQPYYISYPVGPRATPTVDGDRVYTLGAEGRLTCLNVKDGSVVWESSFNKDFNTKTPYWGYSGHPLVDGNKLICIVGREGNVAVAFDKRTGKVLWKALTAMEQGYSCPTIIQAGGKRQLLIWDAEHLSSLDPETGKVYWSKALAADYSMSIMAPRQSGNYLYAGGIVNKGLALKLDDKQPAAEEVYRASSKLGIGPVNATPIVDNGVMYGVDRDGQLRGVKVDTGEHLWETFAATTKAGRENSSTAFLVKNGDRYFLFNEHGDLIIAKLSPKGYEEVSRAHVLDPTSSAFGREVVWSHPAFAEKCMFARNDKELICVSLAE